MSTFYTNVAYRLAFKASSTMNSSSMDEAVRVKPAAHDAYFPAGLLAF